MWGSVSGREVSMCKGPEVGKSWAVLRSHKEAWSTGRWGWRGGWFTSRPRHPLPLPQSGPQLVLPGTLQGPLTGLLPPPQPSVFVHTVVRRIQLTTKLAHVPPVLRIVHGSHLTGRKAKVLTWPTGPAGCGPVPLSPHLPPSPLTHSPATLASLLLEPTKCAPASGLLYLLVPLSRTRVTNSSQFAWDLPSFNTKSLRAQEV